MFIEIDKDVLLKLISKTQFIIEKRNSVKSLANVLLESKNNELKVLATDLETSLLELCSVNTIEPGLMCIHPKHLLEISRKLQPGSLTLKQKQNNTVEIKQGRFVSNIKSIAPEEFPVFPDITAEYMINIDSKILCELIDGSVYCTSSEETRFHLNGVNLDIGTELKMVSTDSHRLALVKRNYNQKNITIPKNVIIPKKGILEVRKVLEGLEGLVNLTIEGNQLILNHENLTIMIRLIEAKYPNYQRLIPQEFEHSVVINKSDFYHAIDRVSLLSSQKSRAIMMQFRDDKLELYASNSDLGDAKEEVEIKNNSKEFVMTFNSKYVLEVLSHITDEEIQISMNSDSNPTIIRPIKGDHFLNVLMPMRL